MFGRVSLHWPVSADGKTEGGVRALTEPAKAGLTHFRARVTQRLGRCIGRVLQWPGIDPRRDEGEGHGLDAELIRDLECPRVARRQQCTVGLARRVVRTHDMD